MLGKLALTLQAECEKEPSPESSPQPSGWGQAPSPGSLHQLGASPLLEFRDSREWWGLWCLGSPCCDCAEAWPGLGTDEVFSNEQAEGRFLASRCGFISEL